MDLGQLRAFIAVAEHGSVTKASEHLHVAQPTLSRLVQRLEQVLDTRLFIRERRGTQLTPLGEILLPKARRVVAEADDLAATALTRGLTVRVGLTLGIVDAVTRVRARLATIAPTITMEGIDIVSPLQAEALLQRQIDVGFGRGVPPDPSRIRWAPLFREQFVVLMSERKAGARMTSVTLRDVANEPLLLHERHQNPLMYDKISHLYGSAGIKPRLVPCLSPTSQAAMLLVESGEVIALGLKSEMSRLYTETAGVHAVPLDEPEAALDTVIIWRAGETSRPVLRLVSTTREVFSASHQRGRCAR